jgi:hypothetical protein
VRDWKQRARQARELRRNAKHGRQQAAWAPLADGNDINTVRREVMALEFLEELGKRSAGLRKRLEKASLSAVEMLARIDKIDATAALQAAQELADGNHTVKSLTARLVAVRPISKSNAKATRPSLDPADLEAIAKLLGGKVRITESHVGTLVPPADVFARLDRESRQPEGLAIITVGPYRDPVQYRQRINEWLWRAMAVAWIVDHVVLLLPSPSHLQEYRNALVQIEAMTTARPQQEAVRLPSVHVLAVEAGHATAQPKATRNGKDTR